MRIIPVPRGRKRGAASDATTKVTRRWWPYVTGLVVLAIGASLLSPAGRHQWALSIFRQPTRYTTLFFSNAATLPTTLVGSQPIPISFTVRNDEGHPANYRYVVVSSDRVYTNTLGQGSRTVAPGAAWRVALVVRPRCKLSPCRIKVSLPHYREVIDFQVILEPAPARPRARSSAHSRSHSSRSRA